MSFDLPARINVAEENLLVPFLQANRTASIELRADKLRRLDVPLVQYLFMAHQHWVARGLGFSLTGLSATNEDVLHLIGLKDHFTSDPNDLAASALQEARG